MVGMWITQNTFYKTFGTTSRPTLYSFMVRIINITKLETGIVAFAKFVFCPEGVYG